VLFGFLLTQDGEAVDSVVRDIQELWGERLPSVRGDAVTALPSAWRDVAEALCDGDYSALIGALAQRNAAVMRDRGNAQPWLEITGRRRIQVRFRPEPSDLFDAESIAGSWIHPYFIPSLYSVLAAVDGSSA
jgi:hypothetical protein